MSHRRMFTTLPMLLTWARILAIPLLLAVYAMPWLTLAQQNLWATGLFLLFAATDWADGFLARRLNQMSAFGAFLDPVADKFLVCASLVLLLELGRVHAVIAFIIIGREIAVSALREWMAHIGARRHVAVHMLGKLKTTAQMAALPLLFYAGPLGLGPEWTALRVGALLMLLAAALTLWSMAYYLRKAWPEIRARSGAAERRGSVADSPRTAANDA